MDSRSVGRLKPAGIVLLGVVLLTLVLLPHFDRLRNPTIYCDDVHRIADLQERPLTQLWFRAFNEHVAPFFETVSWVTWKCAGERLTNAPVAFTLASYVPFVLCLGLLAVWVRLETGSANLAFVAGALFGLSPLYIEAVYWYSASSFTWALAWTLVVLICARSAPWADGKFGGALLLLGSFLAPACSAIGLLAGAAGFVRIVLGPRGRRQRLKAALPVAGTLLYLGLAAGFQYAHVLREGVRREFHLVPGILLALRAPSSFLLPGTLGLHEVDRWLPGLVSVGLTCIGIAVVWVWARRSGHAGLLAASIVLILGGYLITFPFRDSPHAHQFIRGGRFHLFPQLGAVMLIALAASRWTRRLDQHPMKGWALAVALAGASLVVQQGRISQASRMYRFPEQQRTLAALEHLGALCDSLGVTKAECLERLEPVWAHWFQPAYNGLTMTPVKRVEGDAGPGAVSREMLLLRLTAGEREALWGGMNVSALVEPLHEQDVGTPRAVTESHLVETANARYLAAKDDRGIPQYAMTAWSAHLDYEFERPAPRSAADAGCPAFLCLPTGPSSEPLELWWASDGERWSPSRSVRFLPDPNQAGRGREWTLRLDRLPHWNSASPSRMRIRFLAGPVAIGSPRLVR
jgi:hypothetical protein